MTDSPPFSSELESKRTNRFSLPVILLTVFVDLIGFGIIIPLLPFYADALGGSPAIHGVLIASFSLMGFVFAPILGRISDKVGRRPVILTSLAVATAGHLTFALADSLFLLLLSRIVAGIGSANLSVAQASTSLSGDEHRSPEISSVRSKRRRHFHFKVSSRLFD